VFVFIGFRDLFIEGVSFARLIADGAFVHADEIKEFKTVKNLKLFYMIIDEVLSFRFV
jgi:hypothetical protein